MWPVDVADDLILGVQVDLMDHPLHTITYVADIDRVLVLMAHVSAPASPAPTPSTAADRDTRIPPEGEGEEEGGGGDGERGGGGDGERGGGGGGGEANYVPKMTCHVLDTANVSLCVEDQH